ncbi:MAG: ion channel [Bacteroidota bacterium]|nr:ion channel [Bacteroidota bacterium]
MKFTKRNNLPPKETEVTDLGLGNKVLDKGHRVINRDGSFNVRRKGLPFFESFSVYHWLISMSWMKFCLLILAAYLVVNIFFATLYFIGGDSNFEGMVFTNEFDRFLNNFFFSTQTFTTVGYGRINPVGVYANIVSSIESLAGLLSLALATGLLYGRFVKPVAKIIYSEKAVIAPFNDITGFQFRIANKRYDHQMVDVEVEVMLSHVKNELRSFYLLKLEYPKINFFTSTWTVNHPIDKESPIYRMTGEELKEMDAEFFVLLKGFDDTFAQIVHSRSSYKYTEIEWGARFISVYGRADDGMTLIELDKISEYEKVVLPKTTNDD